MPREISKRSESVICRNSSRGKVSRMSTSALPLCECGSSPERSITRLNFRRSIGISRTLRLNAALARLFANVLEDSEAGLGSRREVVLPVVRLESVAAVAEEDEVAVVQ